MKLSLISTFTPKPEITFTEKNQKVENSFSAWLGEKIQDTNTQLNKADESLHLLASGKSENLHQTMLTLEEAKLSFQFLEQIRNRLMTAYQEILREQI